MNLKGTQIFNKCFDYDKIFIDNIYTTFNYMKYEIPSSFNNLTKDNYVNKLIEYIEEDTELREKIKERIFKQINDEEDIILKLFKTENSINQDDIDMINIVQRFLYELYIKQLNLLYFKAEKDQFFSSLLSKKEEDGLNGEKSEDVEELIKKAKDIYLEKVIFNDKNIENSNGIVEQPGMNKIDIILGLKVPGINATINTK